MMVIDTVQEIAPGIVEIDEYVVEASAGASQRSEPEKEGGTAS